MGSTASTTDNLISNGMKFQKLISKLGWRNGSGMRGSEALQSF
jgi:hypothetical protein